MRQILQMKRVFRATLLVLLLCVLGMGKTYAIYSFWADCPSGQRMYYYIIDATNHYVSVTCPGLAPNFGWQNYMEPTGDLVIPESVDYDGITYSVVSIEFSTFSDCHNLTSVSIPNTVNYIGNATFFDCYALTSVNIPDAVTHIGNDLFAGCTSLTSVVIPNSVTFIGDYAFEYCTSLTTMVIPNSVTFIGDFAFENCSNLTSVIIGDTVTSIGWNAFAQCTNLTSIASLATTPPHLYPYAFEGVPCTTLIVPCESKEAYDTSAWADYFSVIEEDCGTHEVIIDESNINGGNMSASASSAEMGEEIQITITPEEGKELASLMVSNANNPQQTVPVYLIGRDSSLYGFIMPPFDVEITATFSTIMLSSEFNEIFVSVCPNPTNGQVRIKAEGFKHISISNMLGQRIYDGEASGDGFSYDLGRCEAGIYIIRIETTEGVATKRVVVTK